MGFEDTCSCCDIMLAVPAAIACADVADLDDARRHLAVAERSSQLWEGTAWQGAILEARAHLAEAEATMAQLPPCSTRRPDFSPKRANPSAPSDARPD